MAIYGMLRSIELHHSDIDFPYLESLHHVVPRSAEKSTKRVEWTTCFGATFVNNFQQRTAIDFRSNSPLFDTTSAHDWNFVWRQTWKVQENFPPVFRKLSKCLNVFLWAFKFFLKSFPCWKFLSVLKSIENVKNCR